MYRFEYSKSKTVQAKAVSKRKVFLVNSLQEKRKYIYFKSGVWGNANAECELRDCKMKKRGLAWHITDKRCSNGNILWEIWRK